MRARAFAQLGEPDRAVVTLDGLLGGVARPEELVEPLIALAGRYREHPPLRLLLLRALHGAGRAEDALAAAESLLEDVPEEAGRLHALLDELPFPDESAPRSVAFLIHTAMDLGRPDEALERLETLVGESQEFLREAASYCLRWKKEWVDDEARAVRMAPLLLQADLNAEAIEVMDLASEGDREAAGAMAEVFEEAHVAPRRDVSLLGCRFRVLARAGRLADAADAAKAVGDAGDREEEYRLEQGLVESEDIRDLVLPRLLATAIRLDRPAEEVLRRARTIRSTGNTRLTGRAYSQLRDRDAQAPLGPDGADLMGWCAVDLHAWEAAATHFSRLLADAPARAETGMVRVLEDRPDMDEVRVRLADHRRERGSAASALVLLREAPVRSDAVLGALERLLEVRPPHFPAWETWTRWLEERADGDAVVEHLERLTELDGVDLDAVEQALERVRTRSDPTPRSLWLSVGIARRQANRQKELAILAEIQRFGEEESEKVLAAVDRLRELEPADRLLILDDLRFSAGGGRPVARDPRGPRDPRRPRGPRAPRGRGPHPPAAPGGRPVPHGTRFRAGPAGRRVRALRPCDRARRLRPAPRDRCGEPRRPVRERTPVAGRVRGRGGAAHGRVGGAPRTRPRARDPAARTDDRREGVRGRSRAAAGGGGLGGPSRRPGRAAARVAARRGGRRAGSSAGPRAGCARRHGLRSGRGAARDALPEVPRGRPVRPGPGVSVCAATGARERAAGCLGTVLDREPDLCGRVLEVAETLAGEDPASTRIAAVRARAAVLASVRSADVADAAVRYLRDLVEMEPERAEEALEGLDRVLSHRPEHLRGRFLREEILRTLSRPRDAIDEIRKEILGRADTPADAFHARFRLADALEEAREYGHALGEWRKCEAIDPASEEVPKRVRAHFLAPPAATGADGSRTTRPCGARGSRSKKAGAEDVLEIVPPSYWDETDADEGILALRGGGAPRSRPARAGLARASATPEPDPGHGRSFPVPAGVPLRPRALLPPAGRPALGVPVPGAARPRGAVVPRVPPAPGPHLPPAVDGHEAAVEVTGTLEEVADE